MASQKAQNHEDLARKFAALADPTRLGIVEQLMQNGEMSVGELAAPFRISKPAISRHLAVLEREGMIERRVQKQWRMCRAQPKAMRALDDWLQQHRAFWTESLDRLAVLFDEKSKQGGNKS